MGRIAPLAIGGVGLLWILSSVGIGVVARNVALAGLALPAAIGIHGVQLLLSAWAWRISLGGPEVKLRLLQILRMRWIREGVNTLLPVAQIGGQVVAVRLLTQAGVTAVLAVAGTILDLTLEAASQFVVILAAVGMLLMHEGNRAWLAWAEGGLGAAALSVGALIAAQRLGLLQLAETMLERLATRWPQAAGWPLGGLHATLMLRQADRAALLRALLVHAASWSLGAAEVWVLLRALGVEVGPAAAFIIETLAMAARSAGFAVPGAVGVQEGGFVLAGGLFGLDAETGLSLSILKRLREVLVGSGALLAWQLAHRAGAGSTVPGR